MYSRWLFAAISCLVAATAVAVAGTSPPAATALPRLLSQTGLYRDVTTLSVDPANRAYSPQYPLWSDGAVKRRWFRLPEGRTVDVSQVDAWDFPVGTRFWKEFSFGGRRVETRLLTKVSTTRWEFASYVWNGAQTDAELAPAEGISGVAEIGPGKRHSIPSQDDCRACHDSNRTEPLGFTALQLSDDRDPLAVHAEPPDEAFVTLSTLAQDGLISPIRSEFVDTPPRIPAASARTRAALGYLSANCGACHNTLSSLAPLGLSFRQPAYGGGLAVVRASLERRTKWDRPGAAPETTRVIDHDAPELSALLVRMTSRRPVSQMPPLGSVVPDHAAVALISQWVREEVSADRKREH